MASASLNRVKVRDTNDSSNNGDKHNTASSNAKQEVLERRVGVAAIDECLSGSGLRKGLGMETLVWVVGDSGSAIETAEVEAIGTVCGTKMRGICCKCLGF
ncbi:hypothetical protein GOBAR_DD05945 [Gossypium barbadense]|nr:hypothetical protein GOBAR_DD05945 [Gossypium barbadense]